MPGFTNRIAALRELSSELDSFASQVSSSAATLGPQLDEISNKADQVHHRVKGLEEDRAAAEKSLDALDGLLAKSKETQNDFSSQFELDMQRVRLGSIDIRDFIQIWGDAVIATEKGFRTIREQFSGADLGQYRQELQDLISDVRDGAADIGQVITFLKENAGDLAKGLINVLDLFKAGKASLEDVQRVLNATKEAFPGADADALADAIRDALLGGSL